MRRQSKRVSLLIGCAVAVSLLFNSVVYACSKLGSVDMAMAMHGRSMATTDGMNERAVERGPCSKHKQDICKSVRDRMLSLQPSSSKPGDYQQLASLLLPLNVVAAVPAHAHLSSGILKWEIAFHSVFKLPLRLFFSVLRI